MNLVIYDNSSLDAPLSGLQAALDAFLAGRPANTRRAYRARLARFLRWYADQPPAPFVAHLRRYTADLQEAGLKPRSVQAHVHAIRGLLRMAAALDARLAVYLPALDLARPPTVRGELQGERLDESTRQALIDLPGVDTAKGRRDTAILALLAVCGLRRSEVAALRWRHIADLEGHHVILNLTGKHGRTRTVKLPPALWRLIISWSDRALLVQTPDSPVFTAVRKGDHVTGEPITASCVAHLVKAYTEQLALEGISPHDLRRTAASLARKGGASIEQVQVMLGHASPQTTSNYIGETLNLDDNAVDYGRFRIPG